VQPEDYVKVRKFLLIAGLLVGAVISGSGPSNEPGTLAGAPYGPDIIHLAGVRNVAFGDTEQELTRRGVLQPQPASCGPSLAGLSTVSPVFADERLVLLWVDSPMHTPEGVTVGTPVDTVRATYPSVSRLTAPQGTYRLDGLLAKDGDRAYLFLHDGRTVQKTIAGYADYAQKLFDEGFGLC
jgi:hypothetical protein